MAASGALVIARRSKPITTRRMFGRGIRENRQNAGLSIEEAARLSGMEVSEWTTVEAGYVPEETNRLRAMAGALEISYDRLAQPGPALPGGMGTVNRGTAGALYS